MKKGILILIVLFCTSCFNFVNYPYKRKLLFKAKSENTVISSIWYYFRKKTDQNTIEINYSNGYDAKMLIYFTNCCNGLEIIRRVDNEMVIECDTIEGDYHPQCTFETILVSDTLNFKNPELNGSLIISYCGCDELQSINRNEIKIEKVSSDEKKILSKTQDVCLQHGIKLTPFDTTKFVAWMKYIGDCK